MKGHESRWAVRFDILDIPLGKTTRATECARQLSGCPGCNWARFNENAVVLTRSLCGR